MPLRLIKNPNDHNPVAQASAAKLTQLLHMTYPEIVPFPTETESDHPANQAQASLLDYLNAIILKSALDEPPLEAIKTIPNIKGTIQWIDYVNALPTETLSDEDKKRIFQQMQVIAGIYPAGNWHADHKQWSINNLYKKEIKTNVTIMTPPALALNLVCAALFDGSRFLQDEKQSDGGLGIRIESIYRYLLELKKQDEAGGLEKCSAGLQHDLLFFLNKSYLDKPREEGGKPVEMPMECIAFLDDSFTLFLYNEIQKKDDEPTRALIQDWIDWEIAECGSNAGKNPMLVCLRTVYPTTDGKDDSGWKNACRQYLIDRCEDFGLDSNECRIDSYLINMQSYSVVLTNSVYRWAAEIKCMQKQLQLPELRADGSNFLFPLIRSRNNLFLKLHKHFTQCDIEFLEQHAESIKELVSALKVANSLYRYRNLSLLLGEEDALFQDIRKNTAESLFHYFNDYFFNRTAMPFNITEVCDAYLQAENVFLEQNKVPFIADFFATLEGSQNARRRAWNRLIVSLAKLAKLGDYLEEDESDIDLNKTQFPHLCILSDETLRVAANRWEDASKDNTTIVYFDFFVEVNRLLLHGLLQPFSDWSPLYCQQIIWLTDFLLSRSTCAEEPLSKIKETYPPILLVNLRFIALIKRSALRDEFKNTLFRILRYWFSRIGEFNMVVMCFMIRNDEVSPRERSKLWEMIRPDLGMMIRHFDDLLSLLSIEPERYSIKPRRQLWAAITPQLGRMIENGEQVLKLFSLSLEQLSAGQRTRALEVSTSRLGEIEEDDKEFLKLFSLSLEQFSTEQRMQLSTAITPHLGRIIKSGSQLIDLFKLTPQQLSTEQRTQILEVITPLVGNNTRIELQFSLLDLFRLSLEQLSTDQRMQLLEGIAPLLGRIINNGWELAALFHHSLEKLSIQQRELIFKAITPQLGEILKYSPIESLLELSSQQLSADQRMQVLQAITPHLGRIIKRGSQLIDLFKLTPQQLSTEQRTQILEVITPLVGNNTRIELQFSLLDLFRLSLEQLSTDQRMQLLEGIAPLLGRIINNGWELAALFHHSLEKLSIQQRELIFKAITPQLGEILKYSPLGSLLKLSSQQLSAAQRMQVLQAITPKRDEIVSYSWVLRLFTLTPQAFSTEERTQIWKAIRPQLGRIIEDGKGFLDLFSLSLEQLTTEQRTEILEVSTSPLLGTERGELGLTTTEAALHIATPTTESRGAEKKSDQVADESQHVSREEIIIPNESTRRSALPNISSSFFNKKSVSSNTEPERDKFYP